MSKILRFDTISEIHLALGLPPPRHPLVTVLPIDKAIINYDYGNATYVYGFYQVALKSGISGTIAYGRNSYDYQEGSMVFTRPGQAMRYEVNEDAEDGEGWVLLFHPDLIRKSELGRSISSYSFFNYETHEALNLSSEEKSSIEDIVSKIRHEYSSSIDRHSQKLIVSNVELLLDYCTSYYDRQFYVRTNLNQDVVSKFENVLTQYFDSSAPLDHGLPTVKHCAGELNMSPAYLGDLLKKETGRNAQQHIQEAILERAKSLLLGSDEQISQIAYALGFEYPQHFSKLFKSKIGLSPAEYRKAS